MKCRIMRLFRRVFSVCKSIRLGVSLIQRVNLFFYCIFANSLSVCRRNIFLLWNPCRTRSKTCSISFLAMSYSDAAVSTVPVCQSVQSHVRSLEVFSFAMPSLDSTASNAIFHSNLWSRFLKVNTLFPAIAEWLANWVTTNSIINLL